MKLDSREKEEFLKAFVGQLKNSTNIGPFLAIEEIGKYGIFDFFYITKNPITFTTVENNLRDHKYESMEDFVEDLRKIFVAVADYVFVDDPLQRICDHFKSQVVRFRAEFANRFTRAAVEPKKAKAKVIKEMVKPPKKTEEIMSKQKPAKYEPSQTPRDKAPTLLEKLQMYSLLKAQENNEEYIRSIGESYGIGIDGEDEYNIHIDSRSTNWLRFITQHN